MDFARWAFAGFVAGIALGTSPSLAQPQPQPQPEMSPDPMRPGGPGEFIEEPGFLRVKIANRLVQLDSLVVRQRVFTGRLPIALVSHGLSSARSQNAMISTATLAPIARDLARRGWLAVVVIRRGFGRSDGPVDLGNTCSIADFERSLRGGAEDLAAALDEIRKRPDARHDQTIAIGASHGGAVSLALAALRPTEIAAVINLAGGLSNGACRDGSQGVMAMIFAGFGLRMTAQTLWVYARNDSLFPEPWVDRVHEAAVTAGMRVRRVSAPDFGTDGHFVFSEPRLRQYWLAELDHSMRAWGMPAWPTNWISTFARTAGFELGPHRSRIEGYISAPGFKAAAASRDRSRFWYVFASASQASADRGALDLCTSESRDGCDLVFRDNFAIPRAAP